MTTRSYSDLSDSATTFDPEEQFDRDIDERMRGMSKEEAVAKAIIDEMGRVDETMTPWDEAVEEMKESMRPISRAAIAAADKWDAEHRAKG